MIFICELNLKKKKKSWWATSARKVTKMLGMILHVLFGAHLQLIEIKWSKLKITKSS